KGPDDLKRFVQDINLFKEKGFEIICSPIGLAPGHNDNIILKKLCNADKSWHYLEPKTIDDTIYLISKSSLYIGTSLHGAITAFSYNKPFIGLNKKVKKLDSYIQTWWAPLIDGCIDFSELNRKILNIYDNWNY